MHIRAAALALAALVALSPLLVAASALEEGSQAEASLFTVRAWMTLNETIAAAEAAGVNLSAYKDNISEANNLMAQAVQAEMEGNLQLALNLTMQAFNIIKNILEQVNAPEPVPVMGLERAKAILDHARKAGVPIPEQVMAEIENAVRLAAQHKINDTVEFKVKLMEKVAFQLKKHKAAMVSNATVAAAAYKIAIAVNSTINLLDKAVEALGQGGSVDTARAQAYLNAAYHRLVGLGNALERITLAAQNWGANSTIVGALENATSNVQEAAALIENATQSLEAGDVNATIQAIVEAQNRISEAVDTLASLGLPRPLAPMVEVVKAKVKVHAEIWKACKCHGGGHHGNMSVNASIDYEQIRQMVEQIRQQMEQAVQEYENGSLSAQALRAILKAGIHELETIKSMLPQDAPQDLLQLIDETIQWAEQHMPQESMSGHGGHGGRHG